MPSLGTLTWDVVAKIGGFVDGLSAAERQAKKSADSINDSIASIGTASYAVGNALGQYLKQGIDFAASALPGLIDSVGKFQDIADKTGGSAAGFAAFEVSAKTAGVSIDSIADASARLSKQLLQAGDDSKQITAGLQAINVNAADLKKLTPDQQIKTIAQAFGNFADGANKSAVALQIFGRNGADLLKFFKDYTDNGGDVRILNDQMIKQADDFGDASKRASAQLEQWAGAIVTQSLPALTAMKGLALDAAKEIFGLGNGANDLASNRAFATFADNVGIQVARILDYLKTTKAELAAFSDFFVASAKASDQFLHGDFAGARQTGADFRKQYGLDEFGRKIGASGQTNALDSVFGAAGTESANSYVAAFKKTLAANARSAFAAMDPRRVDLGPDGKPKDTRPEPDAHTPVTGHGGGADPDAMIKAQLNAQLDSIKNFGNAQRDAAQNSQKILEAMHSAGLTSDQDYYAQRKQLLDADTKAQVDSLNAQIAALQNVSFTGKDAARDEVENQKKIADAQAQLTKVQADGATQAQILGIQEQSTYAKIASSLLAARQAAEEYFRTTNEGYARTLAGIGKGDKTRDYLSQLGAVQDSYQRQRQDLANQRALAEQTRRGPLDQATADLYDKRLAMINEFNDKAVTSFKDSYAAIDAAQKDWLTGAGDALSNYADQAAQTGSLVKGVFDDAFRGAEDVLTSFFSTGKADFKSFANSIIADVDRVIVKQLLLGPLADQLKGALGGGSSGGGFSIGGLISGLFGVSDPALAAANAVGSAGGDALGTLAQLKLNGKAFGGYTGPGGMYEPAGIVHRGEVVWSQADVARGGGVAAVEALRQGGGGGVNQTVVFNVQGTVDKHTQGQIQQRMYRAMLTRSVRMGS